MLMRLGKTTWIAIGSILGAGLCVFIFLALDRDGNGDDEEETDRGRRKRGSEPIAVAERNNHETERKLDELQARLDKLEKEKLQRPPPPPRPRRAVPDPKDVFAVPVAGDPFRGEPTALVTIIRAGEYACPFCEKTRPTIDQLMADYRGKVRFVHKDFIVHPQVATPLSQAACAAHQQGKFWEMDALLWDKAFKTRQFDPAHLESLAKEVRLDLRAYRAALDACKAEVNIDQQVLQKFGVGATPAFFINGRFLSGAQPLPAFKAIIDEELKKAEDRVAAGTDPARYYDEWIVRRGLAKFDPQTATP